MQSRPPARSFSCAPRTGILRATSATWGGSHDRIAQAFCPHCRSRNGRRGGVAQQPTIRWRLSSSFPKAIEGLWGASPTVAKFVNEMSDGKFVIDTFAAGERPSAGSARK
jgi:TRAP-type mannitol/chloroaromatic compound transport system substrate-binding protein